MAHGPLLAPSDPAVPVLEVNIQGGCPRGHPLMASHGTGVETLLIAAALSSAPLLPAAWASSRILGGRSKLMRAFPSHSDIFSNSQASSLHFLMQPAGPSLPVPLQRGFPRQPVSPLLLVIL